MLCLANRIMYVLPVDVEGAGRSAARAQPGEGDERICEIARRNDDAPEFSSETWDFRWQERVSIPPADSAAARHHADDAIYLRQLGRQCPEPEPAAQRVTFGQTTASEMGDLWLQLATRTSSDSRGARCGLCAEDVAGRYRRDEKALEVQPE